MFRAFELTIPEAVDWHIPGTDVYTQSETATKNAFDSFLSIDKKFDGSEIQKHWFPEIDANVFISFSHNDLTLVKGFAQWLGKRLELMPFVDSMAWGYSNILLRQIDDACCFDDERQVFDYNERNLSTGHVHMMLSVALSKMIDAAECVIFLNTPNSVSSREAVKRTASPWIFFELAMFNLIRSRSKEEHRAVSVTKNFSGDILEAKRAASFDYIIDTAPMGKLNLDLLNEWRREKGKYPKIHALDLLYDLVPE